MPLCLQIARYSFGANKISKKLRTFVSAKIDALVTGRREKKSMEKRGWRAIVGGYRWLASIYCITAL